MVLFDKVENGSRSGNVKEWTSAFAAKFKEKAERLLEFGKKIVFVQGDICDAQQLR